MIGANSYIGASAKVHGAILGKHCDVKAGARLSEGVAVGDQCVIGEQAFIAPDVKIYPFKTVDAGARVNSSIIWESRGSSQLFGKEGVSGLINVDITAELALNLAMAYGTMLPKGARVTTSRDAHPASRVIKRALIAGLNSTGVVVRDLRVASSAINRFEVKHGETQGGMHVRIASWDPESIQIQVFEPPGADLSERRQKDIEKFYGRQDFRRAFYSEFGEVQFPDRAMETYVRGLMGHWDMEGIRSRAYRIVVDYSHSPASLSLPHILGDMGAEVLSLRAFTIQQRHAGQESGELDASIREVQRLVLTMEADLGFVIDPGAERLHIIDDMRRRDPLRESPPALCSSGGSEGGAGRADRPASDRHRSRRATRRRVRRRDRAHQGIDVGAGARCLRRRCRFRGSPGRRLHLPAVPACVRRRHESRQAPGDARAGRQTPQRAYRGDPGQRPRPPHGGLSLDDQGDRDAHHHGESAA